MDYYSLTRLIRKYRAGTATPQELCLLENWWQEAQRDTSELDSLLPEERELLKNRMFAQTQRQIAQLEKPSRRHLHSVIYRAAAAVALVAVVKCSVILELTPHEHAAYTTRRALVYYVARQHPYNIEWKYHVALPRQVGRQQRTRGMARWRSILCRSTHGKPSEIYSAYTTRAQCGSTGYQIQFTQPRADSSRLCLPKER